MYLTRKCFCKLGVVEYCVYHVLAIEGRKLSMDTCGLCNSKNHVFNLFLEIIVQIMMKHFVDNSFGACVDVTRQ